MAIVPEGKGNARIYCWALIESLEAMALDIEISRSMMRGWKNGSEKKLNERSLILSTSKKVNPYYVSIGKIQQKDAFAIISQLRLIDTKRLTNKIAVLDVGTFEVI